MTDRATRRRHSILTAKQMHLMAAIAQAFRGLIEIPFGAALEIKPFMN